MAILGALPGIEVTIESQGTALSEYNDDTEWAQWAPRDEYSVGADKWMSKYVECVSDTEFQLRFSMKPPFKMDSDKLSFDVSMDGQGIAEIGMKKGRGPEQSVVLSTSFEQVTPHELALRALRFASIQKGSPLLSHPYIGSGSSPSEYNSMYLHQGADLGWVS